MAGGIPITDPVELAWCEFARARAKMGFAVELGEQEVSIASFKAGAEWERAACAELVRAAGCLCKQRFVAHEYQREWRPPYDFTFEGDRDSGVHDRRCPVAILAAIEVRGRG
jgi:hypothetical protein